MYAVMFEVLPSEKGYRRYLEIAAALRPELDRIAGFVSIDRFQSLTDPGRLLSLSFWRDEEALAAWRAHGDHRAAQSEGRQTLFVDYRLRVLRILEEGEAIPANASCIALREHDGSLQPLHGERYASLADAGKRIDVFDPKDFACTAPRGIVLRDYGQRTRAQAPAHFPSRPE